MKPIPSTSLHKYALRIHLLRKRGREDDARMQMAIVHIVWGEPGRRAVEHFIQQTWEVTCKPGEQSRS